ncbi:MAG: T9SS type A sorting domain-containing protein [Flavobacteriales bacterium]|nr:T9SS type A sorting domain-containing protein [Flavobacteriales bacterium]
MAGNFNSITPYPNPATDYVAVQLDKDYNNVNIRLINGKGQVISQNNYQNTTEVILDLSNYQSGLYFVNLIIGKEKQSFKIIKE